jgi:hypothetical protein
MTASAAEKPIACALQEPSRQAKERERERERERGFELRQVVDDFVGVRGVATGKERTIESNSLLFLLYVV